MSEWISVKDRMPPNGRKVVAFFLNSHGKARTIMAGYAALHTLRLDEDCEGGCACGACPDEDEPWCAEGWYETNEFEETHWMVSDPITHWMPIPDPPLVSK